jgi:glucose/arabinose dehydrogenase
MKILCYKAAVSRRIPVFAVLILLLAPSAFAQQVPSGFTDSLVTAVGQPTALAFTPDGRLLITTQPGALRVYKNGALLSTAAINLSVCTQSERGLLGVAVHPDFGIGTNRFIYLYYTSAANSCDNRVSRFVLGDNDLVDPASETILIDNVPNSGNHNGGDLHFGKDRLLYVSVGDGGCHYDTGECSGANDAAREEYTLLGKILRITDTGGIPASNPFQGAGTARCNTGPTTSGNRCQETFAWGLRNPFRIAFDPNAAETRFFINDVGQNTWEEIDLGQAGADYGWNVREGHCRLASTSDCGPPPAGMTNPIYDYPQSSGCRAITGGAFVPNGVWPAEYDGDYLYADYVCGRIFRLEQSGLGYTSSDFATSLGSNSATSLLFGPAPPPAGRALYYTTYGGTDSVRRITYTAGGNRAPTAAITANPPCLCGTAPLTVDFDGRSSSDPDGDSLSYEWDLDGDGAYDDSTSADPSPRQYAAGNHTVRLRVNDGTGGTDTESVNVSSGNTAPSAAILAPAEGFLFRTGQQVVLRGQGTDAQDGNLAGSQLAWRVTRHHGTTHTHPWVSSATGTEITIDTPAPEDFATARTSYLEVELTATDSGGVATIVRRNLLPLVVDVTFATNPSGLALTVNGEPVTGPRSLPSWVGFSIPVSTASQSDSAGRPWAFASWSDGGAAAHAVPTPEQPATYTARFQPAVQIARIRYDATGRDTRRNRSLNREWVQLRNVGDRPVALTGWTLRDRDRHVYRFGAFTLPTGGVLTLHTGRGTNNAAHRYWGRRGHVWDNRGDTAALRTSSGAFVDACRYTRTRSGMASCR